MQVRGGGPEFEQISTLNESTNFFDEKGWRKGGRKSGVGGRERMGEEGMIGLRFVFQIQTQDRTGFTFPIASYQPHVIHYLNLSLSLTFLSYTGITHS